MSLAETQLICLLSRNSSRYSKANSIAGLEQKVTEFLSLLRLDDQTFLATTVLLGTLFTVI